MRRVIPVPSSQIQAEMTETGPKSGPPSLIACSALAVLAGLLVVEH